jgi:hypothetical protein
MTMQKIADMLGVSITDVKYVVLHQWIPLLKANRQMKDGKTRLFSATESLAIGIAATMHDEKVPPAVVKALMSHISPMSRRRDFPYDVALLLKLQEDLVIFGAKYFGTIAGDKYSLETGHRVQHPLNTVTKLHVNLPTLTQAMQLGS